MSIVAASIRNNGKLNDKNLRDEILNSSSLKIENLSGNNPWIYHGEKTYVFDEKGELIQEEYSTWNAQTQEIPEFKIENNKFNWYIYSCAQLKFLEQFVNNGNKITEEQKVIIQGLYDEDEIVLTEDSTVFLMSNLDFGAREINENWDNEENEIREWKPIGYDSNHIFIATFEGNNHVINGIYVNLNDKNAGVFGYAQNIKDLIVQNSYISGFIRTGGIVAYAYGLQNCHNINTTVVLKEGENHTVGGIVGYFNGEEILNCTNTGKVLAKGKSASNNSQAGGIIGNLSDKASIIECKNYGNITSVGFRTGGITGQNNAKAIRNCENYGKIYSEGKYTGGIAGYTNNASTGVEHVVENCINLGEVESKECYTGGISGYASGSESIKIEFCENKGNVYGGAITGGLIGLQNSNVKVENCTNFLNIKSGGLTTETNNASGGIAGYSAGLIRNCTNRGEIISYKAHRWNRSGGIVGYFRT